MYNEWREDDHPFQPVGEKALLGRKNIPKALQLARKMSQKWQ